MKSPKNTVLFNGVDLSGYGVYVSGNQTFSSAERDYEEVIIPGRSGSLFIDNKTFKNTTHSYDAWIAENLEQNLIALRAFLLSSSGYCRLEDTYHPDEFYKAIFRGPLDVETALLSFGRFTLTFERTGKRFLKSGELVSEFTSDSYILNPTSFDSLPLIRVYGVGEFTVNNKTITITQHSLPYIDIDSEVVDCYCYQTNCNPYVQMNGNFPTISPGRNGVLLGTGITKVEITPRWWTV